MRILARETIDLSAAKHSVGHVALIAIIIEDLNVWDWFIQHVGQHCSFVSLQSEIELL